MDAICIVALTLGFVGMGFGTIGLIAFLKLAEFERHLKEAGVLNEDYELQVRY